MRRTELISSGINSLFGSVVMQADPFPHASDKEKLQWRLIAAIAVSAHEYWHSRGSVIVTSDATLQALLACTPTGFLDEADLISPYGLHFTWFDPPIFGYESGQPTSIRWCCSGIVDWPEPEFLRLKLPSIDMDWKLNWNGEDGVRGTFFLIMGQDSKEVEAGGFTCDPAALIGTSQPCRDKIRMDVLDQFAFRVSVGLSRLIASSTRHVSTGSDRGDTPVKIIDHGFSSKKESRTIHVRKLFITDPNVEKACRESVRLGNRAPCLRHVVRGHWRNQAMGIQHKERNLIWIKPHWRGDMRDVALPTIVQVT